MLLGNVFDFCDYDFWTEGPFDGAWERPVEICQQLNDGYTLDQALGIEWYRLDVNIFKRNVKSFEKDTDLNVIAFVKLKMRFIFEFGIYNILFATIISIYMKVISAHFEGM
jgi:hypothetical protein